MIPGIVALLAIIEDDAAQLSVSEAVAVLDFVNGSYSYQGAPLSAAAVIDNTGRITASGLQILDNQSDGTADIIGSVRDFLLLAEWTLVVEFNLLTTSGKTQLINLRSEDNANYMLVEYQQTDFLYIYELGGGSAGGFRELNPTDETFGTGVHKIAWTRSADAFEYSLDGRAVRQSSEFSSDATADLTPLDRVTLGGEANFSSFNECYIRKITVYPPQARNTLALLSA